MEAIKNIYKILHKEFGQQYWWPVTDKGNKPTYKKRKNLNEKQKLEIVFGAILTQNTNWKNVEKAIINLNKDDLIDTKKIKNMEVEKLALIIKSSGYHTQKAIKLKNFSDFLIKNYNGNIGLLFNKNIAELRNELLSVNGIGPETADSIILYAAQKPIFVIDAYTKRIFNRIGFKQESYEELQELFMDGLEHDVEVFNEYHALIVELGKNVCKKKPKCEICPINNLCELK